MEKKNFGIILIVIILFIASTVCTYFVYSKVKQDKGFEWVENTLVIDSRDIDYLTSLGYQKSNISDYYYTNEETNSGIALTSDEIDIDGDSQISGYNLDMSYQTDDVHERVEVEISNEISSVGTVVINDLDNISEIAIDLDDEQYKQEISSFVDSSRELVNNLQGDYQFDGFWGEPVNTLIMFDDYTILDKQVNGYQVCSIEYVEDSCYSKGDYLYTGDDSNTTVIFEGDNYQLGHREWITQNLLDDGETVNSQTEVRYEHDDTIETYDIDEQNNTNIFKPKYRDILAEQDSKLTQEFEKFKVDIERMK